ncbi:DUF6651 domain-containing protein [Gellertiella hungarica]|nr:DUF6651 domain-containing protein [Gellertiella hungarica]
MKLKLVEMNGVTYAEVQDGKPVYETDDGKTVAFDAPGTVATITRLNNEAKTHREAKEAAEGKLKAFEGLDATTARDALDKLSRIDAKKLVDAGDMDAAIQTALKPVQEQLAAAIKDKETLTSSLNREVIGNAFGRSKFASEKLTPAGVDLIRTLYADRIKVEDGKPIGYDQNGQKIYSKARPGEVADFDEIVESLVDSYAFKDHILKSTGHNGTGKQPGSDGTGSGRSMKTSEFQALAPKDRAAFMEKGGTLVD